MNLSRRRKRQPNRIPNLGKLPPALTDQSRKDDLVNQLRANPTKEVIDELILGHLALGLTIVGHYLAYYGSSKLQDELVGAMSEAVCDAINHFPVVCTHNNVTGYVTTIIHSYLSKAIEKLPVIHVPGSTQRNRAMKGQPLVPKPEICELTPVIINHVAGYHDQGPDEVMVRELADTVCESEQERQVLDLRLEGYSDSEIADTLKLNRKTVWAIRKSLQDRYTHFYKDSH